MEKINIYGKGKISEVFLDGTFDLLNDLVDKQNTIILTDENIYSIYKKELQPFKKIVLPPGEQYKTLQTYQLIIDELIAQNANRQTTLLAVGGGVVCDLCGFVASTFMRGMDFGYISTTVLSQVDASIGGKNGVNFGGSKNIIGTINQPRFVICDFEMLSSLPQNEIRNGFAEIIKHLILDGAAIIDDILENPTSFIHEKEKLCKLISHSVKFKADIVRIDEQDTGKRNILNFGHTFGHAIEAIDKIKHGFAISTGMMIAAEISYKMQMLPRQEMDKIRTLLQTFELPVSTDIPISEMFKAMRNDKKCTIFGIKFVLLDGIGNPKIKNFTFEELQSLLKA